MPELTDAAHPDPDADPDPDTTPGVAAHPDPEPTATAAPGADATPGAKLTTDTDDAPDAAPGAANPGRTTVYTDGACQGNPGPGGWAWAVPGGAYRSGAEPRTTNQRMELQAALDAVTAIEGSLDVVSDSIYVVNCFKNAWWQAWERNGWRNAQRKDVANQDLWRPLVEAYKASQGRLSFRWVKGHGGDPMNDLVDRLAVQAAVRQRGRSGTGRPDDLGPPDRPARLPAR